jgi:hypothetical protein
MADPAPLTMAKVSDDAVWACAWTPAGLLTGGVDELVRPWSFGTEDREVKDQKVKHECLRVGKAVKAHMMGVQSISASAAGDRE